MNAAISACVLFGLFVLGSAIVMPEGYEAPRACATVMCQEGYRCIEQVNPSPFCVLAPCSHIARCVRATAPTGGIQVQPPVARAMAGNCPPPSGFGICALMCDQKPDSCPAGQKCCSNGCGLTCQIPI